MNVIIFWKPLGIVTPLAGAFLRWWHMAGNDRFQYVRKGRKEVSEKKRGKLEQLLLTGVGDGVEKLKMFRNVLWVYGLHEFPALGWEGSKVLGKIENEKVCSISLLVELCRWLCWKVFFKKTIVEGFKNFMLTLTKLCYTWLFKIWPRILGEYIVSGGYQRYWRFSGVPKRRKSLSVG